MLKIHKTQDEVTVMVPESIRKAIKKNGKTQMLITGKNGLLIIINLYPVTERILQSKVAIDGRISIEFEIREA